MSYYPLTAYNYIDPSTNNIFSITNSTFLYGFLGPTTNVQSGSIYYTASNTTWGSLNVVNVSQGNTNLVGFKTFTLGSNTYKTIAVTQSGIYRIKTTLSFTGSGFNSSTAIYYRFSDISNNNLSIPIEQNSNANISELSANQILSLGYITAYNNGSYPSAVININNYLPYITLTPTYSSATSFTNNGLSVIEQILYLQSNTPLYFNMAPTSGYLNATGNFELEMLYASPNTLNPSYINTLKNYTYNNYPIMNSNFIYGILEANNYTNGYTAYDTNFGSLTILKNLYGNTNLITAYTTAIQVNQTGIYRLRTTLSFSGSGFGSGNNEGLQFAYTTAWCTNTPLNFQLYINPSANTDFNFQGASAYVSFGYLYSGNGAIYSLTNNGGIYPVATLNSIASSSTELDNNGISVVESILYLVNNQVLYFNISPGGGNNYLNATGNFMLELLSAVNGPTITINGTVTSGVIYYNNFYNQYNYVEFYAPNTTYSYTITFAQSVKLNYLLIGGGGGGAGGTTTFGGGGGAGSGYTNSTLTGTTFEITVGAGGTGGSRQNNPIITAATIGFTSSISNGSTTYYIVGGQPGNNSAGGTGTSGGGSGGNGHTSNNATSGSDGSTVIFGTQTYYISGGGGGGGSTGSGNSGGSGGVNNLGGGIDEISVSNGGNGSGYGTGGGGGQYDTTGNSGGNGGPGLVVLYW
jgi:hypothetical protein